ncbi:MAG: TIGR04282 family arsenosugar biosynthesis glycosyltransferase [Mucilaginibacter sp.]|uniref:TIGR04282 family arsenosugar biosynthesis glycosyltransferase n=1 Tax=Mucilaginibacter sp. TaxID=1882438 RepID=UPI0032674635
MRKSAIIIFIKNPHLGHVKKRLAKSVGDDKALEVYKQMLEHAQLITKTLSTDKFLYYDKAIDKNDDWPNDIYIKKKQSGTDMPGRITNAFKDLFNLGYEHVVIIGSDCLELDERIIRLAFRQLDHFDTVLGPTKDGGFYLLGMNSLYTEIFKLSGWGTAGLTPGTVKTIQTLNKTCFMLSELAGIITVDDLSKKVNILFK